MRVAVSADDSNGLGSVVSPHFGRCPYYALVDLDGREVRSVQVIENPYYGNHQPGQVPGFIKDLISKGWMERSAHQVLDDFKALAAANIPADA